MTEIPKSRVIQYRILKEIREQRLAPHSPLPSYRELALRFKANRLTVQKAMQELVQSGHLYSLERKGYFVSPSSKHLQILAVAPFWHGSLMPVLRGMSQTLEAESPHAALLQTSSADFLRNREQIDLVWRHLALVVLLRDPEGLRVASELRQLEEVPLCFYGSNLHQDRLGTAHALLTDEARVVDLALSHLMSLHRPQIAILYEKDHPVSRHRMNLALEWLQARGRSVAPEWRHGLNPARLDGPPDPTLDTWVRRLKHQKTAVFATQDYGAMALLQACYRSGISVPESVAVVGVDDVEESARLSPPLTTVRLPCEEDGAEIIHQWLRHDLGRPPFRATNQPRLMVRGSTVSDGPEGAP